MELQEKGIVKIDHKEYGIEETKAQQIGAQFKPMLDTMIKLEEEANKVFALDIKDPKSATKAKEVRLKYVKVRTGTARIHKEQKAFYLSAGRYVDGWKNAQVFASQGIEDRLKQFEDYQENLERERIEALRAKRTDLLLEFGLEQMPAGLGTMGEQVWENFYAGSKLNYENKIKAEKEAEEARVKAAEEEAARLEAQRVENERLKQEIEAEKAKRLKVESRNKKRAEELQPYIVFIRDYDNLINSDEKEYLHQFEEVKSGAVEQWDFEAEQIAKKEEAKRLAEAEAKKQADIIAKQQEKIEAIRLAKEKEDKAAEEKQQAELNANDSAKKKSLIKDLQSLKSKYQFKSKTNIKMLEDVNNLLDKVINHIK